MSIVSQGTTLSWDADLVGEVVDISGPTASRDEIDGTHLTSTAKEFQLALADFGEVTLNVNVKPGDVGQVSLETDFNTDPPPNKEVIITLPIDVDQSHTLPTTLTFNARVSGFEWGIATDELVTIQVTLRATGAVAVVWGSVI